MAAYSTDWATLRSALPVPVIVGHRQHSRPYGGSQYGGEHIVVQEPIQFGRLKRDAFTALCETASNHMGSYLERRPEDLLGTEMTPSCKECLRAAERIAVDRADPSSADTDHAYVDGTPALVGDTVMKASGGGHWEITRFVTLEDTGRAGAAIVSRDGQKTPHGNLSTTHTIDLAGLHFVTRASVPMEDPVDGDIVEIPATRRLLAAEDREALMETRVVWDAYNDCAPTEDDWRGVEAVLVGIVRREVGRALNQVYELVAPGFLTDRGREQLRACLDSVLDQRAVGGPSSAAAWLVEPAAEEVPGG